MGERLVELEQQVAFTLSDSSRALRKGDVIGVCPSPDLCFEFGDRVRCGPCAVKASAAKGIAIDDTHSHLPEVCRLRRQVRELEAKAAEARDPFDVVADWHDKQARTFNEMRQDVRVGIPGQLKAAEAAKHHAGSAAALRLHRLNEQRKGK